MPKKKIKSRKKKLTKGKVSPLGSEAKKKQVKKKKKAPHRFNKQNAAELGRKGGLAGRGPRGPLLSTYMRELLTERKTGDLNERGKEFVEKIIATAEGGQPRIITELLNRLEGKVPDKIEAVIDHGVLAEIPDDELESLANGQDEDADSD